jgi:hypothetical protein
LSERTSVPKPYFELSKTDELVLMKEHVLSYTPTKKLGSLRRVLGYSFFADKLLSKTFPEYWLQGLWKSTKVHSKGPEITCKIFERLKHYARDEKIKLYILIQYSIDDIDGFAQRLKVIDEVISCIDQEVLRLVDLRTSLAEFKEQDNGKYKRLFHGQGHMTREGNYFVASKLWEAINIATGTPNHVMHPTTFSLRSKAAGDGYRR